ncbi:MAG: hypothetical protein VX071_07115, partial [Candidatus Thermoplasmatota archaeon]|nr:hypothetical protein [Candidatus Thermoplasmatota archaeon]
MEMYNPPHAHAHNYLEYSKDQLLLYGEETETEKRWKRENPEGTMDEYLEYLNRMSEIVTPGCSERSKYRHFGADDREVRAYGRTLLSNMSDNRSRSVPTRRREPLEDPEMDKQEQGAYAAMDEDEEESPDEEPTYNRSSSSWQDTWNKGTPTDLTGPRWLKRSKHGWEQTDRNDEEDQWWSEEDEPGTWLYKEDQSWYQRSHAWKKYSRWYPRRRYPKMPTNVDDVEKLS